MTDVRVLAPDRLELGEGGRWVDDQLMLVDIPAGRLLSAPAPPRAGAGPLTEVARVPGSLAAFAPVRGRADTFMLATGTGFAVLGAGGVRPLSAPEPVTTKAWRLNDAVADPAGRFWAGSMAYDESPKAGALYRLDPDGSVRTVLRGLTIANGPAFTPDGRTMFLNDTPLGHVDRFDVDPATGELSGRRPFLRLDPADGAPDGITLDAEGFVWVALFGGSAVHRYRPDGELDRRVSLPARQPTSVCLVGETLVVTSGRRGLDPAGPDDGAVMVSDAGVSGIPALPVSLP
jgi:sugar lactone lactonase YvrE